MSTKQVQDAYIVAATRTPIGTAPRGAFRNTRPDDLLHRALDRRDEQIVRPRVAKRAARRLADRRPGRGDDVGVLHLLG